MSSQSSTESAADRDLECVLEEYTIGRDDHLNAPGFVVRPDEVQAALILISVINYRRSPVPGGRSAVTTDT